MSVSQKAEVRIAMGKDLSEGEAALLRAWQKMREEMDRAWKDFFEKNPDKKEEDLRRRLEERLRNGKGDYRGVIPLFQ